MYQALYRKWRPNRFEDVVGQGPVTQTLKNEIMSGKIAHAYLFTGGRGTGKTTCARILAKAVNCLHPVDGDPCNQCEICTGIDAGSVLDVTEIDAASNNGVDNIRQLREEAMYLPAQTKYRVYIIDEVHMLSTGAFNALLKILEEPPAHILFILATTEVHKVLPTIMSRCQRFDFRRISPGDIAGHLMKIAEKESIDLTEEAALLIGKVADGAMRDAQSILDRCCAQEGRIDEAFVSTIVGLMEKSYLTRLARAAISASPADGLTALDELYRDSKDFQLLCGELADYFRDLLLVKTIPSARDYIACTEETFAQLSELAGQVTAESLYTYLAVLEESRARLAKGARAKLEMETTVIRLCTPSLLKGTDALAARLAKLEQMMSRGAIAAPSSAPGPAAQARQAIPAAETAPPPSPAEKEKKNTLGPSFPDMPPPDKEPFDPDTDAPATALPRDEASADAIQPFPQWNQVLELLRQSSKALWSLLLGSRAYERGNTIYIDADNQVFEAMMRLPKDGHMKKAIAEVTGKDYNTAKYRPEETADGLENAEGPGIQDFMKMAQDAGIPVKLQ